MRGRSLAVVAAAALAASLPTVQHAAASTSYTHLIFDDEFNGAAGTAPDPTKWVVFGGANPSRWGQECFVNDRQHIKMDGHGHLVETATYNPNGVPCTNGSGPYESGGMSTGPAASGLFHYQYGSANARIKVPCQSGTGVLPAFWQDGPNWPNGGEIDNLEIMKDTPTSARTTLHGPTTTGAPWQLTYANDTGTAWCSTYHVFGNSWSPGKIKFTIDGTVVQTVTPANLQSGWTWPFDSYEENLILDLQVGGWGGTVDNTTLPQSMKVDWIRVYQ